MKYDSVLREQTCFSFLSFSNKFTGTHIKMKLIRDQIKMIVPKPRLIVFDLDETLWDLGIDDYFFLAPYRRAEKLKSTEENQRQMYRVVDRAGKEMKPYKEVNSVLHFLDKEIKIPLAVASRTTDPANAYKLLELFNWSDYFQYKGKCNLISTRER